MDLTPLWISLKTATVATGIAFVLGIVAARVRLNRRGVLWDTIDTFLLVPMMLPPTVVGLFLLVVFGRSSPIGQAMESAGIFLVFTWPAAVLAATVAAFPLMYRIARGAFEVIDGSLLDVARTCGYPELRILWQIMIPLAWPGVSAGLIVSFLRALGEFGATLMIAGNIPGRTQTGPIAIYFLVEAGEQRHALLLGTVLLVFSLALVFVLNRLDHRARLA